MSAIVSPEMQAEIGARLAAVEQAEDVRVLFACESGSRGWGFASPDSDYDVRFVYVHRPEWYLAVDLEQRRDVIERPIVDEVDLHGWDLRKALHLLARSNRPLLEWLTTPLAYVERLEFRSRLWPLAQAYFTPALSRYYYLKMARIYSHGKRGGAQPALKSLLYAFRALLAVRWIEAGRGPVPMPFATLVETLVTDPELATAVRALLLRKQSAVEQERADPPPVIASYIEAELARLSEIQAAELPPPQEYGPLNVLFRQVLAEAEELFVADQVLKTAL